MVRTFNNLTVNDMNHVMHIFISSAAFECLHIILSITMDSLTNLLINVPDFRHGLFSILGATDVSMITHLCRIGLSPMERSKYLHPIRDVDSLVEMSRLMIKAGHSISLVGLDVMTIVNRIKDPIGYWKTNTDRRTLTFWVRVSDGRLKTAIERMALISAYDRIMSLSDETEAVSNYTRVATFNTGYSYRLIMEKPMAHRLSFLGADADDVTARMTRFVDTTTTRLSITTTQIINWSPLKIEKDMTMSTYIADLYDSGVTIVGIKTDTAYAAATQLMALQTAINNGTDYVDLASIYGERIIFMVSDDYSIKFMVVPTELTRAVK
ncbi:hypothetical protein HIM_10122 [Hirsutella minnesotensis 3608]|uniref:Uncharacterized protein n=1 Tax=Hirsutella minnesotensis 3608 TaxID=1043627 RepID=A0A0F7ZRZ9_9HYPO|nr:hypothetical protein HIM_10122 [Hirsutella minnesotensis 3608]